MQPLKVEKSRYENHSFLGVDYYAYYFIFNEQSNYAYTLIMSDEGFWKLCVAANWWQKGTGYTFPFVDLAIQDTLKLK